MLLNEQQQEVVNHLDGPCVVVSCPGSGKSRCITERAVKLIKNGVDPENILCVTFTNKAADVMRTRILKRLSIEKIGTFIGTFHSFAANLLRKYAKSIGYVSNFTILDQTDQEHLISKISRQLGYDIDKNCREKIINNINYWRENLEEKEKLEKRLDDDVSSIKIAEEYLLSLKKENIIDFSGLLYEAVNVLKDNNILEFLQNKYKYIQIDESQDCNIIQYKLITMLGGKNNNIILVADPDQSIYRFRNARAENIKDFIDEHKDCKIIKLVKNYRSTPQIIEKASNLISNDKNRIKNTMITDNASGHSVVCLSFIDQIAEAEWVGNHIKRLIDEGGWDAKDIAVLYRINSLSRPIEAALMSRNIKYKVVGGFSFYDRMEVKDIISLLDFFVNNSNSVSFHRIANAIKGVGNITIGQIENVSKKENISLLDVCKNNKKYNSLSSKAIKLCEKIKTIYENNLQTDDPGVILDELFKKSDYDDYLKRKCKTTEEYQERKMNIEELISSAAIAHKNDNCSIEDYLQNILLLAKDKDDDNNKDRVELLSGHSSKGTEYAITCVIGFEDGIIPHKLALEEMGENGENEERRLAYVMISRAKKLLYTTYCKNRKVFSKKGLVYKKCEPSRFLYEAKILESPSNKNNE